MRKYRNVTQIALEHDAISLEEIMPLKDRLKDQKLKVRLLTKLANVFGFVPQYTFEDSDIDFKLVEKYLKHKDLLKVIDEWVWNTNHDLLPLLKKAKKTFDTFDKSKVYPKYYRGFNLGTGQQDLNLSVKGWFGPKIRKDVKVGDKLKFIPDKPLSFTHHRPDADNFGKIIISINGPSNNSRLLHITNECIVALMIMDDPDYRSKRLTSYYVTYAESVLLPDGNPIEFTVENI